jgi:hypothetical protein
MFYAILSNEATEALHSSCARRWPFFKQTIPRVLGSLQDGAFLQQIDLDYVKVPGIILGIVT